MMFAEYVRPATVGQAYELLQNDPGSVLLGGCTLLRRSRKAASAGIDLAGLGLDGISKTGESLVLGAMASLHDLEITCGELFGGALRKAVSALGGVTLRRVITIGGTVAGRLGTSDLLTLLLALDARLLWYKGGMQPLEVYLKAPRARDILTAVHIPLDASRVAFRSMRGASTGYALLNAAAARTASGLRIAVGARPGVAALSTNAAAGFENGGTRAQAAQAAAAELDFADNHRAGGAYRQELCRVLVERALEEVGR